jgi:hypothetical protein
MNAFEQRRLNLLNMRREACTICEIELFVMLEKERIVEVGEEEKKKKESGSIEL